MSRTPKRGKPPGYEYWSKRASSTNTDGWSPGKPAKQATNRILRRRAKQSIEKKQK